MHTHGAAAYIQHIHTAHPGHAMEQEESISWLQWAVRHSTAPASERERAAHFLEKLKDNNAIEYRHSVLRDFRAANFGNLTLFADSGVSVVSPGVAQRMRTHDDAAAELLGQLFAGADAPEAIIAVTCTGYSSPSPTQRMLAQRGWDRTLHYQLGHMGCYAAFPALRLAEAHVLAGSSRSIDICHVELCTVHFRPDDTRPEQLVVQTLFADGAARVHVTAQPQGRALRVLGAAERLLPDTATDMTWNIGEQGFLMSLSRAVPVHIRASIARAVDDFLAEQDLARSDIDVWAIHPGGPRIIEATMEALGLTEVAVSDSRAVLAAHGNMSSATVPHIWKRVLDDERREAGTLLLSMAFGPGLTVVLNLLRVEHHV